MWWFWWFVIGALAVLAVIGLVIYSVVKNRKDERRSTTSNPRPSTRSAPPWPELGQSSSRPRMCQRPLSSGKARMGFASTRDRNSRGLNVCAVRSVSAVTVARRGP
jgi:hypothetical protein